MKQLIEAKLCVFMEVDVAHNMITTYQELFFDFNMD